MNLDATLTAAVNDPRFLPYHGWHDDHRHADRTPEYRPAIQQNRAEFVAFAELLVQRRLTGSCLQLGLGMPGGSHFAFESIFERVLSIDHGPETVTSYRAIFPHANLLVASTRAPGALGEAMRYAPFDLLFIDAGHLYEDVSFDFRNYAPLVRHGGIVAMHDALKRPGYEDEILVWKFVADIRRGTVVHTIGSELGIAYLIKE